MKTSGYRVLPLLRRGSEVRQSAGLIPRHVRLAVKFREIPRIGSEIPNEKSVKKFQPTLHAPGNVVLQQGLPVLIVKGRRAQRSVLGHLRRSSWNNLTLALNVCILCNFAAKGLQPNACFPSFPSLLRETNETRRKTSFSKGKVQWLMMR